MHWIKRSATQVVLYGKPNCHLCQEVDHVLQTMSRRYRLEVTHVDITSDPALYRQYDIRIPVVVIGDIVLEAPIDVRSLRGALRR